MAISKGCVGNGGHAHFRTGRRENEQRVISPVESFYASREAPHYASLARINESLAHDLAKWPRGKRLAQLV